MRHVEALQPHHRAVHVSAGVVEGEVEGDVARRQGEVRIAEHPVGDGGVQRERRERTLAELAANVPLHREGPGRSPARRSPGRRWPAPGTGSARTPCGAPRTGTSSARSSPALRGASGEPQHQVVQAQLVVGEREPLRRHVGVHVGREVERHPLEVGHAARSARSPRRRGCACSRPAGPGRSHRSGRAGGRPGSRTVGSARRPGARARPRSRARAARCRRWRGRALLRPRGGRGRPGLRDVPARGAVLQDPQAHGGSSSRTDRTRIGVPFRHAPITLADVEHEAEAASSTPACLPRSGRCPTTDRSSSRTSGSGSPGRTSGRPRSSRPGRRPPRRPPRAPARPRGP